MSEEIPDAWSDVFTTTFYQSPGGLDASFRTALAAVAPLIAKRERERLVGDMLAVALGLRDIEASTEVPLYTRERAAAGAHALEMRAASIRAQEPGA